MNDKTHKTSVKSKTRLKSPKTRSKFQGGGAPLTATAVSISRKNIPNKHKYIQNKHKYIPNKHKNIPNKHKTSITLQNRLFIGEKYELIK